MRVKRFVASGLLASALLAALAGGVGAAPGDTASELGHCSSMFGKMQLRDDISKFFAHDVEGPPGAIYSEAAKNKGDCD